MWMDRFPFLIYPLPPPARAFMRYTAPLAHTHIKPTQAEVEAIKAKSKGEKGKGAKKSSPAAAPKAKTVRAVLSRSMFFFHVVDECMEAWSM